MKEDFRKRELTCDVASRRDLANIGVLQKHNFSLLWFLVVFTPVNKIWSSAWWNKIRSFSKVLISKMWKQFLLWCNLAMKVFIGCQCDFWIRQQIHVWICSYNCSMVISHYVERLLHIFNNFCVCFLLRFKDTEKKQRIDQKFQPVLPFTWTNIICAFKRKKILLGTCENCLT